MIANVKCPICGDTGKMDCGPDVTTVEQATEFILRADIQHCSLGLGSHMEMSRIEYEVLSMEDGHAMSEEQWLADKRGQGYDLWTTAELYGLDLEIVSFCGWAGMASGHIKSTGEKADILFTDSPERNRYYYAEVGKFKPLAPPVAEATD